MWKRSPPAMPSTPSCTEPEQAANPLEPACAGLKYLGILKEKGRRNSMAEKTPTQQLAEKLLYTLSAGWFYGETPCVLHDSTGLFSKTEKPSVLYLIPMQNYDRLLAESSLFREAILQSYSQKMRILRQEIANLSFTPCKDRLRRLYCSTADTSRVIDGQWYDLKLNYTQYEISTIVGGARVTITKLINELCAEGFIRVLNRKTQINIEQYKQEIEKDWA